MSSAVSSSTTPTSNSFTLVSPIESGGNSPNPSPRSNLPFRALQIHKYPPNFQQCLAMICNGQLETNDPNNTSENLKLKFSKGEQPQPLTLFDQEVRKTILLCTKGIFVVDGGVNFCKYLGITDIMRLVGDMDSGSLSLMEGVYIDLKKLRRAKDESDLDAAMRIAHEEIPQTTSIVVFGGLGGRVDHTLNNIFLLFRERLVNNETISNHGKLFFYSRKQLVFSLNDKLGKSEISMARHETLALVPLYGTAEKVRITYHKTGNVEVIERLEGRVHLLYRAEKDDSISVEIEKGELICCLHKERMTSSVPKGVSDNPTELSFLIETPLVTIFEKLLYFANPQLSIPRDFTLSGVEHVYFPRPGKEPYTFRAPQACTVSLIPIGGPVKGLVTNNLKWELGNPNVPENDRITELSKGFVGLSNVMMKNWFTLRYDSGSLLVVITEFIDKDMLKESLVEAKANDDEHKENELEKD